MSGTGELLYINIFKPWAFPYQHTYIYIIYIIEIKQKWPSYIIYIYIIYINIPILCASNRLQTLKKSWWSSRTINQTTKSLQLAIDSPYDHQSSIILSYEFTLLSVFQIHISCLIQVSSINNNQSMIVSMTFGYQMWWTQMTFNMIKHLVHPPAN